MKTIKYLLCILCIALLSFTPIQAEGDYVTDNYGLLTQEEISQLNNYAAEISNEYGVGVYVRVENTYDGYASIEDYSEAIYTNENLGAATDGNVVAVVLTMNEREYDIVAHGDIANASFTDYGKEEMANDFVPYLSDGEYYSAFDSFLSTSEYYLRSNQYGEPVDTWIPDGEPAKDSEQVVQEKQQLRIGMSIVTGVLVSLITCFILKARNKTAGVALQAQSYIPSNGVTLTGQQDIFLYQTRRVTHINRDHGGSGHSGGTSVNSGGFSHSSGKF